MAKKSTLPTVTIPTPEQLNPQTAAEFAARGWLFLSKQQYAEARADLESALALESDVDYYYALGLILRAAGKNVEALAAFEKAISLVPGITDPQRATMLNRLTLGQINMIKTGDWNLEKEVWKRIR
jgi:tetratricopeptide (TPR) repeat protein